MCGVEIYYTNVYTASRAENKKALCTKCSRKLVANLPHVKEAHRELAKKRWPTVGPLMRAAALTPNVIAKLSDSARQYRLSEEGRIANHDMLVAAHQNLNSKFNSSSYKEARKEFALKGLQIAWMCRSTTSKPEQRLAEALSPFGFELNNCRLIDRMIPDIIHLEKKIIVEFYGDYYHCNPNVLKYEASYYNKRRKKTAQEIWNFDAERITRLEKMDYKVIIVWEADFEKDLDQCVTQVLVQTGIEEKAIKYLEKYEISSV